MMATASSTSALVADSFLPSTRLNSSSTRGHGYFREAFVKNRSEWAWPCHYYGERLSKLVYSRKGKTEGGGSDMATIQLQGENIRQAVKWISAELQEDPSKRVQKLVQEAALRFNLSPLEEEYLVSFYRKEA